jgi:hypothetical protein
MTFLRLLSPIFHSNTCDHKQVPSPEEHGFKTEVFQEDLYLIDI